MEDHAFIWSDTAIHLAGALVLLALGRFLYGRIHRSTHFRKTLLEDDNAAFALHISGYFTGLILAVSGALVGPVTDWVVDTTELMVYGLLSLVLMHLGEWFNDRVIFRRFPLRREILEDRNIGAGALTAANFIATGAILHGAISGEGINFFEGIVGGLLISGMITSIVFWAAGMVALWLFTALYDRIIGMDLYAEIERDNAAAGIAYAGLVIAVGLLVGSGLSGDFYSWADHFSWFGIEVALGAVLLLVARLVTEYILLPGHRLADEIAHPDKPNVGAGLIEAFAYIGGAILIILCL